MYYEARDKDTRRIVGYGYGCHGCGARSPVRKKKVLPPRWVERTELYYNDDGKHLRHGGFVVNAYCPRCVAHGCTAHTVAATTMKIRRLMLVDKVRKKKPTTPDGASSGAPGYRLG